jgi:GNAT superfamily N-acetyltransferase
MTVRYRSATHADAEAVAALHADSWRRHYRGAYSDAYLDGPIHEERRELWTARLTEPSATSTVLAEMDGGLVGFVHVVLDADPIFGALVDNLHVRHDIQRIGIGAELMARAAELVMTARPAGPMYLWVLEQNDRAQAFYRGLGGKEADRNASMPPGGGSIVGIRYVWPDPAVLARRTS